MGTFFAILIWGFIILVPVVLVAAVVVGWRAGTRGMDWFWRATTRK